MKLDDIKEIIYKETSLMEIEAEFLAEKIFEKIESRKCANCQYAGDGECTNDSLSWHNEYGDKMHICIDSDFGCNDFVARS